MRLETQTVTTSDGITLFVRDYHPDQPVPGRVLYWVHGIGEHGGRYEHVAEVMVRRGWRLILPDLRGHGQSTGVRTHVQSFDAYIDDIALVWKHFDLQSAKSNLLGHSMGGLVAIRAVQTGKVAPTRLAISSPLLGLKLNVNRLTVLLGRMVLLVAPSIRFSNGIDPANMTRDPTFAAIRRADALINKTVTAGWYFAMRTALKAAWSDVSQVTLPVYAQQGASDRTTDPDALTKWYELIPSANKQLVMLDDQTHELFFESDWAVTVERMLNWLEASEIVTR